MNRHIKLAICLCLTVASVCNLSVATARAENGQPDDRPIRLYASSSFGPIGTVDSPWGLTINGRATSGKNMLWGNELIYANADASTLVEMHGVSRITLSRGTIARFSTAITTRGDERACPVLVASLTRGEIRVELEKEARAHVEATGSAVSASAGASFQIGIRQGELSVDATSGEVEIAAISRQQTPKKIAFGESRDTISGFTFIELSPSLDVMARTTRYPQSRVTDENDKPIPDLPVVFVLSSKSLGVFPGGATTFTTTTNAQGVASAPFTAGPSPTSGTLTTTVEGTNVTQTVEVRVKSKFWTPRKIIAGLAVGLLTGIILVPPPPPEPPGPLRQVPSPDIP